MTDQEQFILILAIIIGIAFFVILAVWTKGDAKFGKKQKSKVDVTPPTQEEMSDYLFLKMYKRWKDTQSTKEE